MKTFTKLVVVALPAFLACIPVPSHTAEMVSLVPDADTTLFENNPNNNLGASMLAAGTIANGNRSRALVRFDLSSIPPQAVVESVIVTFRVVRTPPSPVPSTFDLHRLFVDWGEGTKSGNQGAAATPGEATWLARHAPSILWSQAGAAAPDDFDPTPSASSPLQIDLGFESTDDLVADVQDWVLNPDSNFGWILMSQSESVPFTARRFGSRETPATAPTLVVEYSIPATVEPPILADLERIGDEIQFTFQPAAGQAYAVEFTPALPATEWSLLQSIESADPPELILVTDTIGNLQRFYRVRAP
jgi:hypothetical protein